MPRVQVNGQNLYFEDTGGDLPPSLWLHGFLLDHSMFDPQVASLSEVTRIIRFDARGFGQTEWDGKPFSLYDTVADGCALLDHLGLDSAVWVGMSQGGYASLRAAISQPDRVEGLVLLSTRSGCDEPEALEGYRHMRDTWVEHGPLDELLEGLLFGIIGPEEQVPEHRQRFKPRWQALSGNAIFHAMNNLLERDEIDAQLGKISCPSLVAHGDADPGISIEWGRTLAEALPKNKSFVTIPGAWHSASMTHPEPLAGPLRAFLEDHWPAGL